MKSTYVVAFFAIVGLTSTHLCSMDFLNDPFFKQLAGELDSMFGTTPDDGAQPAPYHAPGKPAAFGSGFGAKAPAATTASTKKDDATPVTSAVADAAKDLKTLFLENLEGPKTKPGTFGAPAQKQTKIVISKKRMQAYNLYMGDLVKKSRLIERIVASNPARTFGHRFLVSFDGIIDFVDKIEIVHQLILSKKMYLRSFFGQPMQKTREQIVVLMPKIDATLRKLRPLLTKEESLDDDISRMQREAKQPVHSRKVGKSSKKALPKPTAHPSNKLGRALPQPKKFGWPATTNKKNLHTPKKPATHPLKAVKKSVRPPRKEETFPADFSLKKFMHEKGVS